MSASQHPSSDYKLGIFYYNKSDKRIWVPKRLGIGYTVNFANPWSYVSLIVICGAAFALSRFLKR